MFLHKPDKHSDVLGT